MRSPLRHHSATLAVVLAACSGESRPVASNVAPQDVQVRVTTATPRVHVGGRATFTAAVTGTSDGRVRWAVVEPGGGSIDGTGSYLAPATPASYHVRATSLADESAFDVAAVGVEPSVVVTVSPSRASTDACQTVLLAASLTNVISNGSVTWTVQEGASGGTVSPTGSYVAPAGAGTYHVVATSAEEPARSAAAEITVTERVLSVQVRPSTVRVQPGGVAQFTADVTTTCGTFPSVAALPAQ